MNIQKIRNNIKSLYPCIFRTTAPCLIAAVLMYFLGANAAASQTEIPKNHEHLIRQLKEKAIPILSVDPNTEGKDLEALKDVIGNASIVLLGESQHRLHEQYRLKHRIVKFMIEEMGFTHILIEDSFYGTIAIDDFIKGADISAEAALQKDGGWYLWDTEEMLAMIKWLRSHNEGKSSGGKVSYIGMDIQDPWQGIRHLAEYFISVDPEFSKYLQSQIQVFEVYNKPIWIIIKNSYPKLTLETKQNIEKILKETGERLQSHREKYIKTSGLKAFQNTSRVVQHLLKSHKFFLWLETAKDGEVGVREKTMFNNVVRIKGSAGPKAKIIVWAHNAHAAKSPVRFLNTSIPESAELELMGTMLKRKYSNDVKAIGMASLGPKMATSEITKNSDILDRVLAEAGLELCFLVFHELKVNKGNENLLMNSWRMTADQGGYLSLFPLEAFDAMFFVKYATIVRYSLESAKRFKTLF